MNKKTLNHKLESFNNFKNVTFLKIRREPEPESELESELKSESGTENKFK